MKLKVTVILFLIILINTCSVFSQNDYISLQIEITNLKNNQGLIALQLANKNGVLVKGVISSIENKHCEILIDSLNSGTYSIRYFHDENSNDKLDTNWLGLPTEGYGFSNNASARFGAPSIQDREFELKYDLEITLTPQY